MSIICNLFVGTIQGLKKHLSKEQADFKQEVDDIQVILTSPSFTDKQSTGNIFEYLYV